MRFDTNEISQLLLMVYGIVLFSVLPIQFQIDIEVALTSIFAWNMKGKNQSRSR